MTIQELSKKNALWAFSFFLFFPIDPGLWGHVREDPRGWEWRVNWPGVFVGYISV